MRDAYAGGDEEQVRRLIDDRALALCIESAEGSLATQTVAFVQYGLFGPLQSGAEHPLDEAAMTAVFARFDGPIDYEMADLSVSIGDKVAFSRSLSRIAGTRRGSEAFGSWFRKTLGFQRTDGVWKIAHEHESVPAAEDGSGKALMALVP